MKTVLIVHGIGGRAGIHWQQWLSDNLAEQYQVLMPDLPESDHPSRQEWLNLIQKTVVGVSPSDLIIVGHSLGVTTALDLIEQSDSYINGLISVSGFAQDYGSDLNSYFLKERSINFEIVRPQLNWSEVIYGDNDPYVNQEALNQVAESLGVDATIIHSGGHLNSEAGFTTFPLLLDVIKKRSASYS